MVCFDGQNQSPSRKVKAEETGMEHERRERWKRRKRWNTRKTGHHLSSATLDDRCFLETLNLDFNIFKPHLTVYIQAIDNEFELFLPWTRLFGHLMMPSTQFKKRKQPTFPPRINPPSLHLTTLSKTAHV